MKFFSPSKINLSLNVGDIRSDGYHAVDSVFHLLTLGDIVTIEFSDELSVTASVDLGIQEEQNLAYKAALAMADAFDVSTAFAIHIDKRIPHGGGLAGGSSNAATIIYALATINGINPHSSQCLAVARRLGADVAVFLAETPAVVMTGRGDEVSRTLSPVAGLPIVIAIPQNASSSTAEVYAEFDKTPHTRHEQDALIKAIEERDIADLALETYNNLGPAAIRVCPQTGDVLALLRNLEAVYSAQVSGSGAACFALCKSKETAEETAQICREAGHTAFVTELAEHGIHTLT